MAVEVSGIPPGVSAEFLELWFENKRKSGGADIEFFYCGELANNQTVTITYDSVEVAKRVANTPQIVMGATLRVQHLRASAAITAVDDVDDRMILILNSPPMLRYADLQSFLSRNGDFEIECFCRGDDPSHVLVKFLLPIDFPRLTTLSRLRPLQGKMLVLSQVVKSKSVLVQEVKELDDTLIYHFFENPGNGGGRISHFDCHKEENYHIIQFEAMEDACNVLQRQHTIKHQQLQVSLYHECIGILTEIVCAGEQIYLPDKRCGQTKEVIGEILETPPVHVKKNKKQHKPENTIDDIDKMKDNHHTKDESCQAEINDISTTLCHQNHASIAVGDGFISPDEQISEQITHLNILDQDEVAKKSACLSKDSDFNKADTPSSSCNEGIENLKKTLAALEDYNCPKRSRQLGIPPSVTIPKASNFPYDHMGHNFGRHVHNSYNLGASFEKRGIKIHVCVRDITKLMVDAVVTSTNTELSHGGGVAGAIGNAAGPQLQAECTKHVRRNGKLATGKVYTSKAYDMFCERIIHVVGPRWSDYHDKKIAALVLSQSFMECLEEANRLGVHSVAMPAVGSGIYASPLPVVAQSMFETTMSFVENHHNTTSLRDILLVDINASLIELLLGHCQAAIGEKKLFCVATTYHELFKDTHDNNAPHAGRRTSSGSLIRQAVQIPIPNNHDVENIGKESVQNFAQRTDSAV